jgi:hypothetical protein
VELGESLANPFWVVFKVIFGFTPNLRWMKKLWKWLNKSEEPIKQQPLPTNMHNETKLGTTIIDV